MAMQDHMLDRHAALHVVVLELRDPITRRPTAVMMSHLFFSVEAK